MKRKKLTLSFDEFMFIFGILAPMPIISFFGITAYVWCILICGIYTFLKWSSEGFIISRKIELSYLLIIVFTIISYIFCFIRMPDIWTSDLVKSLIQYICLILVFIYFSGCRNKKPLFQYIKGIYISSLIQMIWGYLQLLFSYFSIDINYMVFNKLLKMAEITTQQQFGRLKISGFCWNAGNLAPLIIFGYVYTKNKYLKLAFIILSLLSGSRTMILGMGVCLILQCLQFLKTKKIKKNIFAFIVFVIIFGVIFILLNYNAVNNFITRLTNQLNIIENISTEGSTNTHYFYLASVLDVTRRNSLLSNLVGYGPGCSGYVFTHFYNYYSDIGKWNVECDYINMLWNYGYIGFVLYYFWYIKNVLIVVKIDKKYLVMFFTFLAEGFFYNITFNWMELLIIIIFILDKKGTNIFEIKKELSATNS